MSACYDKRKTSSVSEEQPNFGIFQLSVFETESPYVVQGSIEILILLPLAQKFWD